MARTYRIRRFATARNNKDSQPYMHYSLTIPAQIAEKIPDDLQFRCELTQDGILFRPAQADDDNIELPSWAQPNGAKKPTRKRSRKT